MPQGQFRASLLTLVCCAAPWQFAKALEHLAVRKQEPLHSVFLRVVTYGQPIPHMVGHKVGLALHLQPASCMQRQHQAQALMLCHTDLCAGQQQGFSANGAR